MRKGIILAGGKGTRLSPLTNVISKQLMPVFDKPMIYYPLSTLMLSGIREFLVISTEYHQDSYKDLLGDGSQWGIDISYAIQDSPDGIAQAFTIGEKFISDSNVALVLGDNLFHGNELIPKLEQARKQTYGATLFAYPVNDPERYGIVEFNAKGIVCGIEEKPKKPKSRYAVTGLYFYDNSVIEYSKQISNSNRNELEITEINKIYLNEKKLKVQLMGRGTAWLDTGTIESLHEASSYIRTLEHRQGLKISCPEEIAWRSSWISDKDLEGLASPIANSGYGKYLLRLLNETLNEKELHKPHSNQSMND